MGVGNYDLVTNCNCLFFLVKKYDNVNVHVRIRIITIIYNKIFIYLKKIYIPAQVRVFSFYQMKNQRYRF